MNAYDFDNTIYDGESLIDFFMFCMSKNKRLFVYLPLVLFNLFLYKTRFLTDKKIYKIAKKFAFRISENKVNILNLVDEFWIKNEHKLKPFYLKKLTKKDVIITGSPRFLMEGVSNKLNTKNIICSEYNLDSGEVEFICFKENKVNIFRKLYPNTILEEFYTDSLNDIPMLKLAKRAYLVKKNKTPILIDANKYN